VLGPSRSTGPVRGVRTLTGYGSPVIWAIMVAAEAGQPTRATLVIAVAGLLVALTSLCWNIWTFLNNRPKVLVSWHLSSAVPVAEGVTFEHVAIRVYNGGSAAVTIERALLLRSASSDRSHPSEVLLPTLTSGSSALPKRLDPNDYAVFYVSLSDVEKSLGDPVPKTMVAGAVLASGKRVEGGRNNEMASVLPFHDA
jgi:hypothetical protein